MHRLVIGVHAAPADEGLHPGLELEAFGDILWGGDRANLNQFNSGRKAEFLHFNVIGTAAGFAAPASEAVTGQAVHGGPLADEHASAMFAADQGPRS